ncbi:MATE family efflux transporter [Ruminococcaceae bacterium OttesenSCG-928-L11]|nr:MATE family efflux transporter [Ruminococcaceae bacterium OttesenSCG-928-L11]
MAHNETKSQTGMMRGFAKYVSLNVLGMIGLSCYILADTFYVSKALGAAGLAALNFSISLYCILSGAGLMLGIGGATRYAILLSRGEEAAAGRIFNETVRLGVLAGLAFAAVGLPGAELLAQWLGADPAILPLTATYLRTIFGFAPFFLLNNVMIAFVRNDGAPGLAMAAMLVGSASNIVLDYVFMFPLGMGMFGAAFATCLAPVISLCLLATRFRHRDNRLRLAKSGLRLRTAKDVLGLGLSTFITEASSGVVLIVFNLVIVGLEGNTGVAAYGVVANLALVVIAIYTGMAQGIQPLVSRGHGKGDTAAVWRIFRAAALLALAFTAVIYGVAILLPDPIVAVFNSEGSEALARLAREGLRLYFAGFFFAGFNVLAASFLSSREQPQRAFVISILRGFVAIVPLVLVLSRLLGMNGAWLSFGAAEVVTAAYSAATVFRLRAGEKQRAGA